MSGGPLQRVPAAAAAAAMAVYLLTPAASSAPLGSWPLTPAGSAVLVVAIGAAALATRLRATAARPVVIAIAILIAARLGAGLAVPETGWLARYFANDSFTGSPEWSSDYRFSDATRIDPDLAFGDRGFPVHFLNGAAFVDATSRDVSVPMSVEWRGAFDLADAGAVTIAVRSSGDVSVTIDGNAVPAAGSAQTRTIDLNGGAHTAAVRYRKPAGVEGALDVTLRDRSDRPIMFSPRGSAAGPHATFRAASAALDFAAVGVLALIVVQLLGEAARRADRAQLLGAVAVITALGAQGFVTALPFLRFRELTGGDDWFGFESRARDVLQHGLLMPMGSAIGEGVPYFYHPFYSYFLAGVHAVSGESLFGPIFAHFLILGATVLIAWSLAARLFGRTAASVGVAVLIGIFEIDFIRYYTITLLSENLYVLTVSCCLAAFARWAASAQTPALIAAGAWGGLSTVTRPSMLVFFVPALVVTAAIARRQSTSAWPRAVVVVALTWMAVVLPFTIRNWVVSKQFVVVSAGQGGAVIVHNVPPPLDPKPYLEMFQSGQAGTVAVLWQLLSERPAAMVKLQLRKLGFTLGMVQWFEGYRPHPELVVISALYLITLAASQTMRRAELWPVHAFVLAHVASMGLTSPWNYGYRLILPPYVYTSTLSVAAAWSLWMPGRSAAQAAS